MCGIAVAIDWPDAGLVVNKLIEGVSHRGDHTDPLASLSATTALRTRRLRIVDVDHAVQPQLSCDGRILVAFNGEIYNHAALREELSRLGARFKTNSDTEVLANALQFWGASALSRFMGMYAFVAIDMRANQFLAARDPMGEKPLYVIQSETGFLFCSEIRPLLNATEAGEVLLIPPGFLLTRNYCKPFYSLPGIATAPRARSSPRELDELLSSAVRGCIPPDLPFALMFSGGIDSTLIAHYARQVRPDVPGYFLGGEDAPDFPYAARYAEATGFDMRQVPFDGSDPATFARADDVVRMTETFEPSVVRPSLCYHVLAKAMHADNYRVALVGEGADELYCGYVPLELTFAEGLAAGAPVRDQCVRMLHRSALQRTDRCAMNFQIEARAPFLNTAIVEHAYGLSAEALVGPNRAAPRGKEPLRALYNLHPGALPPEIRDRRKIPLNEGSGLDVSQNNSRMKSFFEDSVSDPEYRHGRRVYSAYNLESKEDYFYIEILSRTMDISRVPHLKDRLRISVPNINQPGVFKQYQA
jgi:asparagine synthase (glutamine-hydrolysing)